MKLKDEISRLEQELDTARDTIAKQSNGDSPLEGELCMANTKINKLKKKLMVREDALDELEAALEEKSRRYKELEDDREAAEGLYQRELKWTAHLEAEQEKDDEKREELKKQVQMYKNLGLQLGNQSTSADTDDTDEIHELNQLRRQVKVLEMENASQKSVMGNVRAAAQMSHDCLAEVNKQLKAKFDAEKDRSNDLKTQLDAEIERADGLQIDLEVQRADGMTPEEVEDLAGQNTENIMLADRLAKEGKAKDAEIKALKEQLAKATAQCNCKANLSTTDIVVQAKDAEIEALNEQLAEAADEANSEPYVPTTSTGVQPDAADEQPVRKSDVAVDMGTQSEPMTSRNDVDEDQQPKRPDPNPCAEIAGELEYAKQQLQQTQTELQNTQFQLQEEKEHYVDERNHRIANGDKLLACDAERMKVIGKYNECWSHYERVRKDRDEKSARVEALEKEQKLWDKLRSNAERQQQESAQAAINLAQNAAADAQSKYGEESSRLKRAAKQLEAEQQHALALQIENHNLSQDVKGHLHTINQLLNTSPEDMEVDTAIYDAASYDAAVPYDEEMDVEVTGTTASMRASRASIEFDAAISGSPMPSRHMREVELHRQKQLKDLRREILLKHERIQVLDEGAKEMKAEVAKLRAEKIEAETAKALTKKAHEGIESQMRVDSNRAQSLSLKVEDLQTEQDELIRAAKENEKHITKLTEKNEELSKANATLEENAVEMSIEKTDLEKTVGSLRQRLSGTEQKRADLEVDLEMTEERLMREIRPLRGQLETLRILHELVKKEAEELKAGKTRKSKLKRAAAFEEDKRHFDSDADDEAEVQKPKKIITNSNADILQEPSAEQIS